MDKAVTGVTLPAYESNVLQSQDNTL